MPRSPKALVIACESYPKGEDIAQELKGTLDSARGFYSWLTTEKGLAATDIYVCCDSELVTGHPATRTFQSVRPSICDAISELTDNHRNSVNELYVYFSGHGLGYEQSPQQRGLDLLLATDYRNRKRSGSACINIGELQAQFEIWLGGDDHYYFLDACRTVLKAGEIVPTQLGLALDPATAGDPTTYALYSTKFGEVAAVNAKFPNALLAGLRGDGRAKTRVNRQWWVRFDRLQKYVDACVDMPTDSVKIGAHDGLIAQLNKTFETNLTVRVDDADPAAGFELKISNGIEQGFPFTGGTFEKALPPNDAGYSIGVFFNGRALRRVSPSDESGFDLYEPIELHYRVVQGPQPEMPAFREEDITGASQVEPVSKVRTSIARQVPTYDEGRLVDFSETLGPIAEQRTALWLSVLGASRIIRDPSLYSKIGRFPLAHFEGLQKDECAIYVLAGLEKAAQAQLAISTGPEVNWKPLEPVPGFDGIVQQQTEVGAGSQLVSIALPGQAPVTFATQALPNRAVLFIVTEDNDRKLEVHQMLLPIYTLSQYLPGEVTERVARDGLRLVRFLVLQQDHFARREPLDQAPSQQQAEPLVALASIYDAARRGGLETDRGTLENAVAELERYFGELPDVAAARRLLNPKSSVLPTGIPILRESLLRMPKLLETLPLPAGLLDYGSMWTSWVGAVEGPVWKTRDR